jgi:translation initiation factor IF-3
LGIKALPEAQSIARSFELDLVEVAPDANPPVCKIMNFTKFKYEEQQRAKESRKKATNIVVKEMKYRPKIGGGDFDTKTRKVAQFLGEGHKVKLTIMFRGREMQHPELGRRILDRVAEEVADVGKVEAHPKQDGRNMTMVLGPDKKAQEKARKDAVAAEAPDDPDAADPVSTDSPTPSDGPTPSDSPATSETPAQDESPAQDETTATEPAPTTEPAPVGEPN